MSCNLNDKTRRDFHGNSEDHHNHDFDNCQDTCQTCNTCNPKTNGPCCTGLVPPKFDPCKAETIFALVERVYDGKIGPGSAIVETITTDTIVYTTTAQFTPCNLSCCNTSNPLVGPGAVFTVECVESELLKITADSIPSIMVNGTSVVNVFTSPNGEVTVGITSANGIPNAECECKCQGTKSTLMLSNLSNWNYMARHKLTGKANYQGQVSTFCIIVEDNSPGHYVQPVSSTSTLLIPEICIPNVKSNIIINFDAKITLLNPTLTVQTTTLPTTTTNVFLTSSVILSPEVIGEVVENTRVCMEVML